MNILCGIIQQTSGEILILNKDIRSEMDSIRQLISYCPQRIFLFFLKKDFNRKEMFR